MSDKILDFWGSGQEPEVPDYITKEELIAASQDCLPYKIIETDGEEIRRFCLKLEAHDHGANGLDHWLELVSEIFGFIIFNKKNETHYDAIVFIKVDSNSNFKDIIYFSIEDNEVSGTSGGYITSTIPLLITFELGQTWGYLETENGIVDVEVCSREIDLYDWKSPEDWVGKPYIRKV